MKTKTPIRHLRKIMPITNLERELSVNKIDIDRIIYLHSESSYTIINLDDGRKIISLISLKRFTEQLSAEKFMRVHSSYIIRKSSLSCYLSNQNKIVLHNSQEIPVSNSKKEGLLIYLKTLMV